MVRMGFVGLLMVALISGCGDIGRNAREISEEASYSEGLNSAESAAITVSWGVAEVTVSALAESDNLFEADIVYVGDIAYDVTGDAERRITLTNNTNNISITDPDNVLRWSIGVSPQVPLALTISGGVGTGNLNLQGLHLSRLEVNAGVGEIRLTLPLPVESYLVDIDGGVGTVSITVPEGAGVRLLADQGVGSLDVPDAGWTRVEGGSEFVGAEGVWENDAFASAEAQITINYNGGVGTLRVR